MVDLPVWERPPDTAAQDDDVPVREGLPEKEDPRPSGPCDLYTWQSRRIRLFCDADGVYGVLIANGDRLTPEPAPRNRCPPGAAAPPGEEARRRHLHAPRTRPRTVESARLEAILTEETSSRQERAAPSAAPKCSHGSVRPVTKACWKSATRSAPESACSTVASPPPPRRSSTMRSPCRRNCWRKQGGATGHLGAVVDAEEPGRARQPRHQPGHRQRRRRGQRPRPGRRSPATLDRPYRRLASLNVDTPALDERRRWQHAACYLISRLGKQLVEQAGPGAWRGRRIDRGKGEVWDLNTATADSWFRNRLRRIYPYAYETRPEEVAA